MLSVSYYYSEFGPTFHFRCKNPGSSAGEGVMCCWKITQMNDVYRQQPVYGVTPFLTFAHFPILSVSVAITVCPCYGY